MPTREQMKSLLQGEIDQMIIDDIMRERERIFTLVCRVCPNHEEDFKKIIMGNRK